MDLNTYLNTLTDERKPIVKKIHDIIAKKLPKGFELEVNTMLNFVVPHKIYPKGYHCNPKNALPFISIASQKNFVAIYHMGIYADENLLNWFVTSHNRLLKSKLDMGKSCIRFKKMEEIPYDLIAELCQKMTVKDWITLYEKNYRK